MTLKRPSWYGQEAFIQSLKDFFEALDTDASGSIHLEEIKIMLQDTFLAHMEARNEEKARFHIYSIL